MAAPVVHPFPVRRPGFIEQASWIGDDDDLSLQCSYRDQGGMLRSISFETRNAERPGEICIPTSNDVVDLGPNARDILVAHTRMACMIAGLAVPGSQEFEDAFVQSETNNLQTAIGTVKVVAIEPVSDQIVAISYRKGSGPIRSYEIDHGELNRYAFTPSTQLWIVPGSVEKQFSGMVHDHPSTTMSSTDKQNVVDYVCGLAPWV